MSKVLLKQLFICLATVVNFQHLLALDNNSFKILFLGHAYGPHNVLDRKLDNNVIKILENRYYDEFVFGGDFIYDCNDEIEFNNLIKIINTRNTKLTIGNHDNCEKVKKFIRNKYLSINQKQIINNTVLLYLNTSIENNYDLDELISFTSKSVKDFKNVIIFCHQVIFSPNDFYLRTNSRKFYGYGNLFFRFLENAFKGSDKNFYIFTGDIGAFNYTPYSFYEKDKNFNLFAVGLGNKHKKNGIEIIIGETLSVGFIDIKSYNIVPPQVYNKLKMQIFQLPKLLLFYIKSNIEICIILIIVIFLLICFRKFKKNIVL